MKAKYTLMLTGLLALSTAAFGVSAPPLPGSFTFLEMTDHSNGTTYSADTPGTYTRNPDGTWSGPGTLTVVYGDGAWNEVEDRPWQPGDADAPEDTWGVFAWKILRPGIPVDNIFGDVVEMGAAPGGIPTYKWSQDPGAAGVGLVGMYYGGQDVEVTIRADGSFEVHSEGVQFEMWAVDTTKVFYDAAGTIPTDHEGPAYDLTRRTAQNEYALWLDATDATKIPVLRAESGYFVAVGQLEGAYFIGSNTSYYNIVGDPNVWLWNKYIVDDLFTDPEGNGADLWANLDLIADSGYEWLTKSNDDGGFQSVPEPMTMATIFAAVAGLGGYLKRRRNG